MEWEGTKLALQFLLGFVALVLFWFGDTIIAALVRVWRTWQGKDNVRTRTSKHETTL
jgi:hypothetical protein